MTLAACSTPPLQSLQVDPCTIEPGAVECYAVPLNQPAKDKYTRAVNQGDVCFSQDDYAKLQKQFRETLRRCGDRCN